MRWETPQKVENWANIQGGKKFLARFSTFFISLQENLSQKNSLYDSLVAVFYISQRNSPILVLLGKIQVGFWKAQLSLEKSIPDNTNTLVL